MEDIPEDGLNGLAPVEPRRLFGTMPNANHQNFAGFMQGAPYELAIVEFDDQGRCYHRSQMDAVAARLDALRAAGEDVIILVFVHGWKHDARSDDENLCSFRRLLARTVAYEASLAPSGTVRKVLGIFVGWRGLTTYGPTDLVADTTFWGRQEAGHRVATGSPRELFGRLRHYRNSRLNRNGAPLLVIAGHSFGGMIVFSSLAQSLIEAASDTDPQISPRFADLVLLVNPAIEGARYLPIYDLVSRPEFAARSPQLPLFICAQADNDQPVGTWFPVGNFRNRLSEDYLGDLEKRCVTHAIGFIDEFRTHRLDAEDSSGPASLDPPGVEHANPFWVVRANRTVIDGHGGIWQEPFEQFLASVVFRHVDATNRAQ